MSTDLEGLSALAKRLVLLDMEIADRERETALLREQARVLREESIPCAMMEMDIKSIELADGSKLSWKLDVFASIPSDQREAAFGWLNKHGFGGIVKVAVTVNYAKGDQTKAAKLFAQLEKRKLAVSYEEGVNAQTLKAFLREQVAEGTDIPLDLFGARPTWVARITPPKSK